MQHYWLNHEKNDELILFFTGWGFDENPFKHLDCGNYDVLMFYDYHGSELATTLELATMLPESFDLQYKKTHLIAWSMGVFIARHLKVNGKKVAINGTTLPMHNEFGIPVKIFELTMKHAAAGLQGKFYKNVFGADYERYLQTPVMRSVENRVAELESLHQLIHGASTNCTFPYCDLCDAPRDTKCYDVAFIGTGDKIIPPKNQLAFWGEKANLLETGHFPFYREQRIYQWIE